MDLTPGHVRIGHLYALRTSRTIAAVPSDHDPFAAWIASLGVRVTDAPFVRGLHELTELRKTLVRVERHLVLRARRDGSTWGEIGDALEISRQSAFARHRSSVRSARGDSPRRRT